ncbi:MAG: KilA-N domain-containing protein [Prevotella sp.]|nr:KilA-N domain-containing protein [Prevotella sp.]
MKSPLAHLLYILYSKEVENGFTQCLLFNYFPFVVSYSYVNGEDYICITDMLKAKDGDFFVTDWLRNRNTMEFLGMWERIYNPNFNYGEFATIRNQSGLNRF